VREEQPLQQTMMKTVSLEALPLETGSMSSNDLTQCPSGPMTYANPKANTQSSEEDLGGNYARDVVIVAAKSAASQGMAHAKSGITEVHRYAQQNPDGVRVISFCIASALLIFSVLGLFNVFDAVFKPYQYLFSLYNIAFAAVIIVADGNPEWFTRFWDAQGKLFGAAAFLASQTGRAAFYFYVGSINLFMLPDNYFWKLIYVAIGGALCFNGALMLVDSAGCCCRRRQLVDEPLFVGP